MKRLQAPIEYPNPTFWNGLLALCGMPIDVPDYVKFRYLCQAVQLLPSHPKSVFFRRLFADGTDAETLWKGWLEGDYTEIPYAGSESSEDLPKELFLQQRVKNSEVSVIENEIPKNVGNWQEYVENFEKRYQKNGILRLELPADFVPAEINRFLADSMLQGKEQNPNRWRNQLLYFLCGYCCVTGKILWLNVECPPESVMAFFQGSKPPKSAPVALKTVLSIPESSTPAELKNESLKSRKLPALIWCGNLPALSQAEELCLQRMKGERTSLEEKPIRFMKFR